MAFRGSFVALITPFAADGSIDYPAFEKLVDWHIENNTQGIVCAGTTGEGSTLSAGEKLELLKRCIQRVKGQIPVILNTGTNDTRETVELTQKAKQAGADGALVIVPYYNRPTKEGCLAHFREVDRVGLPMIVYHHPKRTGITLDIDSVEKLASLPSIVAMKDAYCHARFVRNAIRSCPIDFLSGDDMQTFQMIEMGCVGAISVIGNIIPQKYQQYIDALLKLHVDEAGQLFSSFQSLLQALSWEVNPQCVKYIVSRMGMCSPFFRLPLIEPSFSTKKRIDKVLSKLEIIKQFPQPFELV